MLVIPRLLFSWHANAKCGSPQYLYNSGGGAHDRNAQEQFQESPFPSHYDRLKIIMVRVRWSFIVKMLKRLQTQTQEWVQDTRSTCSGFRHLICFSTTLLYFHCLFQISQHIYKHRMNSGTYAYETKTETQHVPFLLLNRLIDQSVRRYVSWSKIFAIYLHHLNSQNKR